MKEQKNDQRVRITKTMLRQALIELMEEKSIQSITIKELCDRAGVNRGTFYTHYCDIYDLLEQIETEMFEELNQALQSFSLTHGDTEKSNPLSIYYAVLDVLSRNYDMCTILLGENSDKRFVSKIIDLGKEKCLQEYQQMYPGVSRRDIEFFYSFVASGYLAILRLWIEGGMKESTPELAEKTEKIILGSVQFLQFAARESVQKQ